MGIHFDAGRWEEVKENARRWWAGELDRPLLSFTVNGYESDRPASELRRERFQSFHKPEHTAEQIVDSLDYNLSTKRFFGDGFPAVWPNFGPGVVAAFTGCNLNNADDTVWFNSPTPLEIADVHVKYTEDNYWFRRIRDINLASQARWQGLVQVGMTDLGGSLDVVASFRGSEPLLFDLYDNPAEVKRVNEEVHQAWWKYFDVLDKALKPGNPGYTAWTPVFSEESSYMLQCDFAYMLGPDMFDEFVKPELAASCRKLKHAFYHLDGVGQLPHLDSLLSIPELAGIQWIPGAGQKLPHEWPDVFRRIRAAGKRIQIYAGPIAVAALHKELGDLRGFVFIDEMSRKRETEVIETIERFGR